METTVIKEIINFLFGKRYYANIILTRGTTDTQICSYIFKTKEEANQHKQNLQNTASFQHIETITFRSHKQY